MAEARTLEPRMNAETFMAWQDRQPEGRRFELFEGRVYEMNAERAAHAEAKMRVAEAFRAQIRANGLPCQGFGDGMAVRVNDETVFEPDAMVRCGERVAGDAVLIVDPVVVVEVLSPTTQHVDVFRKFSRYFRNASVMHYLIINVVDHNLAHHRRTHDGRIESSHHDSGGVNLDPPGLTLDLASLFADLSSA